MAEDPIAWAHDRRVAIRPDGARRSFDPVATCLLRSDEERAMAATALHDLHKNATGRLAGEAQEARQ
jgi:hypothetical protein